MHYHENKHICGDLLNLAFKKINIKTNKLNIVLWSLTLLLLLGLFFFIKCSLNIISETSKNNFEYTTKVRDSVEDVDKIVERGALNIDVFSDYVSLSYQPDKLYNKAYNKEYLADISFLVKSMFANSPGVDGSWFQINADVPFSNDAFVWYGIKNGKIVNLKSRIPASARQRKLTPQEDPYYFEAINAKKVTWSEIYIDADINVPMITISRPIYIHNKLIGVVGIDVSVNSIEHAMSKMQKNFDYSDIYLLNEKNEILISKAPNKLSLFKTYKNLNISEMLNLKNSDIEKGMIEYFDHGISKTALFLNLSNNYHVLITFPNLVIYKGFDQLFIIIHFIFIIVVILTVYLLMNRHKMIEINEQLVKERYTLRTIIDSSPNVIIIKDLDEKLIDFNKKFMEVTGMTRYNLLGKTAKDLFNEEKVAEINKNTEMARNSRKGVSNETYYFNANGENVCVDEHIIPLYLPSGKLCGFIIIGIDLNRQKQLQENLKTAKDKVELLNCRLKNSIVNCDDELRQPIANIVNSISQLKKTKITHEQVEIIQVTQREFQKIIDTFNNIISYIKNSD